MNPSSTLPWIATGIIIFVVTLSGPLVPAIDFTSNGSELSFDEPSSVTVSVVKAPNNGFRIATGRFGTGPYLYTSPAVIHVERVSGVPIIAYELSIPELRYTFASLTFPSDAHEGKNLTLAIERSTIQPEIVTEPAYPARLSIIIRTSNETRTVYEQKVTVSVGVIDEA